MTNWPISADWWGKTARITARLRAIVDEDRRQQALPNRGYPPNSLRAKCWQEVGKRYKVRK